MELPDFIIIPSILIKDRELQPLDREVYGIIYWAVKLKNEKCTMSNQTIADLLGASLSGIANALVRLKKKEYINVVLDKNNHRVELIPLISFKKDTPYSNEEPPLLNPVTPPYSNEEHNKSNKNNIKKDVRKKNDSKNHVSDNDVFIEELLSYWNALYGTNWKGVTTLQTNYAYWLKIYTPDEIKRAVTNIKYHDFWRTKMTPSILLRQKNPRREDVDYIGELLHTRPSPVSNSGYKNFDDLVREGKFKL
jgi:hypothetical protein